MTYGCELTSGNDTDHFFSSYKSASEYNTIDVLLITGHRQPESSLQLFLFSYDQVNWRLMADSHVSVGNLQVVSACSQNRSVFENYCLVHLMHVSVHVCEKPTVFSSVRL